jgi:hypothetical protein
MEISGLEIPGLFEAALTLVAAAWLNDFIRRRNSLKESERALVSAFQSELKHNHKMLLHNDDMIKFGLDSPLVSLSNQYLERVKLNPPKKLKNKELYEQIVNVSNNVYDINYAMKLRENLWNFRDRAPEYKDYSEKVEKTLIKHIQYVLKISYTLENSIGTREKNYLSEVLQFWTKYFGLDAIFRDKTQAKNDNDKRLMQEAQIINERLWRYPIQRK